MKPPPFEYLRPDSLDQVLTMLGEGEDRRVLAGGQSLLPMLALRFVAPDALIDINRVPGLAFIEETDAGLAIGAMTRQRALERSPLVRARLPLMTDALAHVGHRQIRNRGTLGGSLCHLDPSAELPTVCLAYDAEVEIASLGGRRRAALADFITGYMSVDLAPGELLTRIDAPAWPPGHGRCFLEHARRHGDFAIACVAALALRDAGGRVARVAIAVGGLGDRPLRLAEAEHSLLGGDGGPAAIARAAATLADAPCLADVHADEDYRRHVAATLVRRALTQALQAEAAP